MTENGIPSLYSDLYFTCSSGILPAKICPTQQNHKCKEQGAGEFPYLIHFDTATQNIGDFFCRWTLVLAAAVAAAGVVTGGAALVALAAIAVIASGTLCGGMMAPFRKWVGYSTLNTYGRGEMPQKWISDLATGLVFLSGAAFISLAIVARSTGLMDRVIRRIFPPQSHNGGYSLTATCKMICPIGGVITYAPGITGFWSVLAYTARNVGFAVLEGIFWGKFAAAGGTLAAGKASVSFGKFAINMLFLQGSARIVGTADQVFVEGMLRDGKDFSETGEYAIRGATMFEQPFINMYNRIEEGYYTGSYAKDANGNIIEDAQNGHGAGAFITDFYYSSLSLMGLKAMVDVSRTTPNVPLETLNAMRAQIKALTKFGKGILFEISKGIAEYQSYFKNGKPEITNNSSRGQGRNECAPTSLAMILDDLGKSQPLAYIREALKHDSNGAFVRDIPSALKELGIENNANYSKTRTVGEIEAALNDGHSVIASVNDGQGSHAVVVDRVENGNVVIRDPLPEGNGSVYSVPTGEFESANTGSVVIDKNK